ncbi:MAG: penicillin-binding transpeptidase domain-containing protein, partial [Oscillospiraceae bacterium]|nr:penicillin-binding transpeptidase domain-containing protein [Oscillospiraceae bacterium]
LNARDVSQGIQGAITMMDYEGRITAMVGQLGKKPSSRSLNRATTNRQPGSSIKPLSVYAPAVEKNLIHWSKLYNDSAFLTVNDKRWPPNYNGTLGSNKMVTVQYALAQSLNTVPARIVHNDLGVANAYDFATENLRLSNLNPAIDRASISAMALGGGNGGVNTVEMAAAYATFGNGGQYYKPHSYYKVTQEKDNEVTTLLTGGSEAQQAMKPETAELMRRMLYNIWRGSYTQNADTRRIKNMYMKSGTTNEHKDRWLAIGAPSHVFVAWYGFDQPKETSPRGTQNPGGVMIFNLLNKISGGLPAGDFKNTGNVVQRSYCTQTGNLAGKKCAKKSSGWYARTALPSTCNGSCAKEEKPEKTTERQMDGD